MVRAFPDAKVPKVFKPEMAERFGEKEPGLERHNDQGVVRLYLFFMIKEGPDLMTTKPRQKKAECFGLQRGITCPVQIEQGQQNSDLIMSAYRCLFN